MIPEGCKRLAKVDFSIAVGSRHSAWEKSIRHGHTSTLLLWWVHRPLAACRAAAYEAWTGPVPVGPERRTTLNAQADISRLVHELRERTGLTQENVAAKLGVTYPTINRCENNRAKPSPLALKQIEDFARGLGERGKDILQEFFPGEES